MYLPDINFWLALTFVTHQFHPPAKTWFDRLGAETCYFCRYTQQGFLRLANDPRVMQDQALSMDEAWHFYDVAMTDIRISFADEPAGLEVVWRNHTGNKSFSPKVWSDAYLAAFAATGGYEVITFDQGFARYGVPSTILR